MNIRDTSNPVVNFTPHYSIRSNIFSCDEATARSAKDMVKSIETKLIMLARHGTFRGVAPEEHEDSYSIEHNESNRPRCTMTAIGDGKSAFIEITGLEGLSPDTLGKVMDAIDESLGYRVSRTLARSA